MIADSRSAIYLPTHGYRSSSISNFGYRKSWHLEVVVANSRSTCYKTKVPPRRVKVKQIQLTFIKIPLEKYAVILVWSSMKKTNMFV